MKLSVLQRLPKFYPGSDGKVGSRIESAQLDELFDEENFIALKMLSYSGIRSWEVMRKISQYLTGIHIENYVQDIDGGPCLFIRASDEAMAMGRLKNIGIAIADFMPAKPYC